METKPKKNKRYFFVDDITNSKVFWIILGISIMAMPVYKFIHDVFF
jgi:hypothetical protein